MSPKAEKEGGPGGVDEPGGADDTAADALHIGPPLLMLFEATLHLPEGSAR